MQPPVDIGLTRVLEATGGSLVRRGPERFQGAVIDGRAARPGTLFFAIRGPRYDGHDFAGQAVRAGAAGLVVARGRAAELTGVHTAAVIEVEDPARALGALARAHRRSMPRLKVAAITGSNGKTTTKEMLAAICAVAAPAAVLKTEGNLNNHLGLPLTLLGLTPEHRFAVVEMGMSALGEIAYLASLAEPDVAVVVNVAPVHLEQLGSIANVARAKGELFRALGPAGRAVLPVGEPLLAAEAAQVPEARRFTFGPAALGPTVGFDRVEARGTRGLGFWLHLPSAPAGVAAAVPLIGAHQAWNAAAAAAAAVALGMGADAILTGLAQVAPPKHRTQLLALAGRTIVDDCYNSSPLSARAALEALQTVTAPGRRRIAVLGDMLELGVESARLHAELGAYAAERVDELVAFGPLSATLAEAARARLGGAHVLHTSSPSEAARRVLQVSSAGDAVLVKASRGIELERVLGELEALARAEAS